MRGVSLYLKKFQRCATQTSYEAGGEVNWTFCGLLEDNEP